MYMHMNEANQQDNLHIEVIWDLERARIAMSRDSLHSKPEPRAQVVKCELERSKNNIHRHTPISS